MVTDNAFNLDSASIPSNYSRLIARELQLQVPDLPKLLAHTGITVDQFTEEETLLTAKQQVQVLENAIGLSSDEAFGLNLGKRLTPPTHGAMGFLASSSPNFLMALKAFEAYIPTRLNFVSASMEVKGEWLEGFCYFDIDLSEDVLRCLSETFAKIIFDCAEFILGRPLDEANVFFAHQEPGYSHRYVDYMPGQFNFGSKQLMVKIPIDVCYLPNESTNHENYLFAMRQCELMQAQLESNRSTSKYKIQKMMLEHPPGVLSEEEAAAALFVSKRTLARRLKKEGTAFRKIRDEILSRQASDYLRDSNMSVEAIADLLNYHDSANFRRAFKRWFEMTPDQYRNQLHQ